MSDSIDVLQRLEALMAQSSAEGDVPMVVPRQVVLDATTEINRLRNERRTVEQLKRGVMSSIRDTSMKQRAQMVFDNEALRKENRELRDGVQAFEKLLQEEKAKNVSRDCGVVETAQAAAPAETPSPAERTISPITPVVKR